MSFASDILSLMTRDASINAEVEDRIYYENLPDNFDLNLEWILYHYRRASQTLCLNNNGFTTYELTVILITQDTERLEDLTEMIIAYLNGNSYNDIIDIAFTGDGHSFDQEKNIYMNTLSFDVYSG